MKIYPIFAYYPSGYGHFFTFEAQSIKNILVGDDYSNYAIFAKDQGYLIKNKKALTIIEVVQEEKTYVFFHYLPTNGRYSDSRLSYWIEGFYIATTDFKSLKNHLEKIKEIVRLKIQDAIGKHCNCTKKELFYIQCQKVMQGIKIPEVEIELESLFDSSDLFQYAICYSMELTDSTDYKEIQNPYKPNNIRDLDQNKQSNLLASIGDGSAQVSNLTQQKINFKLPPNKNKENLTNYKNSIVNFDKEIQISLQQIAGNFDTKGNEIISLINQHDLRMTDSITKLNTELMEVFKCIFQDIDYEINNFKDFAKHEDVIELIEKYNKNKKGYYTQMIHEINEKYDKILFLHKQIKNLFLLLFSFFSILLVILYFLK